MSENTRQPANDTSGKSRQATMQSYQPVWMAHWMPTSSNSAADRRNHNASGNNELNHISPGKDHLTNVLENPRTTKDHLMIKNTTSKVVNKNLRLISNGTSARGSVSPDEGTSKTPLEWMNTDSSSKDRMLSESKPSRGGAFGGPSKHILPYYYHLDKRELDKGKAAVAMPFPNQSIALEKTELKKSQYDYGRCLQKLPSCIRDVETMRICTTVEARPGGRPRFSHTTHGLLITKKTDVNISMDEGIFGTARLITTVNGNASGDLHSLSPFFCQGYNRGVRLQPLSSSSTSEGRRNVGGVEASKAVMRNESSAETDTMEMDFFKEDRSNSGANSVPSNKDFNIDLNFQPRTTVPREAEHQRMKPGLPDINLELSALPAVLCSSENVCPSSSRTQSLEMETLFAHAHQPNPKSILSLDDPSKADPSDRWVKHLKLSSSNPSSARPTKIETPSHNKMRKFFQSILESTTLGGPTRKHHGTEMTLLENSGRDISKENKGLLVGPEKKGKELLLSHAWIKRWLRNESRVVEKKPEGVVICEPNSSKLPLDDLQKKQFPSIAAMALMGKAMSGFQSCELHKTGSFTVWNTKTF